MLFRSSLAATTQTVPAMVNAFLDLLRANHPEYGYYAKLREDAESLFKTEEMGQNT